jgi:hypothetical protein
MLKHNAFSRLATKAVIGSMRLMSLAALALVALLILTGPAKAQTPQPAPQPAPLPAPRPIGFGYTLDALNGARVSGAAITVDGKVFKSNVEGIYQLTGLKFGKKLAVVTKADRVPVAVHFSVHQAALGAASVHIPAAYLVPKQRSQSIPAGGGTIYHNQYALTVRGNSGAVSASLTGFGDHPGTPAPPVSIPTVGSPQQPMEPIINSASTIVRAFPQAVFYCDVPAGATNSISVPLPVVAADPIGTALALLRFNTSSALWERAGDFSVTSPNAAVGSVSQSGLFMVVTQATITRDAITHLSEGVSAEGDWADDSTEFTLPASFTIEPETTPSVRRALYWFYGWREGDVNLTGVRVDMATEASLTSALSSSQQQSANECEEEGGRRCKIDPTTINGCGSTITVGGFDGCCTGDQKCQIKVRQGKASDDYDADIGVSKIEADIKAKGTKTKSDISVDAGCF